MIFVPILKTKTNAEPVVIEKVSPLFGKSIIPYLEIKKDLNDKNVIQMRNQLSGILHFEGIFRKKGDNLAEVIRSTESLITEYSIPVVHLISGNEIRNSQDIIIDIVNDRISKKKPVALRMPQVSEKSVLIDFLFSTLDADSYLFIDIGDDSFSANSAIITRLCKKDHKCKIIVISNERPSDLTGDDYEDQGYNEDILNTSLLESIKTAFFPADGFGSYCTAKNNLNEGGGANPVYAAFLIYNFEKNSFFSIRSDKKEQISKAYASLKSKVLAVNDSEAIITEKTPLSYENLNEFLKSNLKGNASTYYRIGMINYIEQIKYNLFPDSSL